MEWKEEFKKMMEACKERDKEVGTITREINETEFEMIFKDKTFIRVTGNPHLGWIEVNANNAGCIVHPSIKVVKQMLTAPRL